MIWQLSNRADPLALPIADRHYNRQKPGTPQFMPPGSCVVFRTANADALWGTSWPLAKYTQHKWAGAWVNSIFRKESADYLASDLIWAAVAATRWWYGQIPELGMVTFIDRKKVRPIKRRGKWIWGYSYLKAGFKLVGETKGGLLVFQLLPRDMPTAAPPISAQLRIFARVEG